MAHSLFVSHCMCAIKRFGGQKVAKTNITTSLQVILLFVSFPIFMTLFSHFSSFLTREAGWLHYHWEEGDRQESRGSFRPSTKPRQIGRWFHLRRKNVDASLNFMAQRFGWSPWSFMRDVGWDFSQKRQSQFNARTSPILQSTFSGKWHWYISRQPPSLVHNTHFQRRIREPSNVSILL